MFNFNSSQVSVDVRGKEVVVLKETFLRNNNLSPKKVWDKLFREQYGIFKIHKCLVCERYYLSFNNKLLYFDWASRPDNIGFCKCPKCHAGHDTINYECGVASEARDELERSYGKNVLY